MSQVTKRTVSTDALETLGTIIDDTQKRDAIHLAVLPVVAGARLKPGQSITVTEGIATPDKEGGLGIVDPFLGAPAMPGERFWMVLRPRLVTSLRHVWSHSAFPDEAGTRTAPQLPDFAKLKAQAVIEEVAEECDTDVETLMYGARSYLKHGDYLCEGGKWDGVSLPERFWPAYEIVTGDEVPNSDRGSFFSCSC